MRLAIGYDLIERHTDGNPQSFSRLWKEYADERGVDATVVDPLSPGALDVVRGCDAFIWRYNFRMPWTDAAPGIMRAVEDDFGLPVWPGRILRETFENKIAQSYLLDALNIPHPRTWVFWRAAEALERLDELPFPLVAKLSRGVRSEGVALIRDRAEAEAVIDRMFTFGLGSMDFLRQSRERRFGKYNVMLRAMRRGRFKGFHERGYVLFQEFVPGNAFDTRVVVQGDRITASRRRTREGDFRASGSGVSDFDPAAIDPAALALAVELAEAMKVSSLVADVIHRGTQPLINEFSYSMAIHVVRSMPGHWRRGPEGMVRVDAPLDWPRAILDDFLAEIGASAAVARTREA
jgi:hypothetical protein